MRPTESGATGDSPVYFHYQVGRPAKVAGSPKGPTYPDSLKESNLRGEVTMTFIVDTSGHVESNSLKILETTHPLFSGAAREWLLQLRFVPAGKDGVKVRQSAEQTVVFHNPR
jgi:TonB family protein